MLSNKLISFSKGLSKEFINHIDSAHNLCMYKLGSHYIPNNVIFPKAETVTLINCNRNGILNILTPTIFPNLSKVNYLSADPGDFKIYERFSDNNKWVFPNKSYDFYDFMVKSGRGKKDNDLIKEYVASKKIVDGKNGFDISFHFELNIPGFGITDGEWWRSQFYEYLVDKQNKNNCKYLMCTGENPGVQDEEELALQRDIVKASIDDIYFEHVIDEDTELK